MIKSMRYLALVACAVIAGCDAPAVRPELSGAWVRETAAGVAVSAGYGRIENKSGEEVRLISVETPLAGRTEIHNVVHDGGVMRMRELPDGLPIPAGGSVELKPGGYHLMLLQLKEPLRAGTGVPVALRFDNGESIAAVFPVRTAAQAAEGGGR